MSLFLFFYSLAFAATHSPKKPRSRGKQLKIYCQESVTEIMALEAKFGELSKESLHNYAKQSLELDSSIPHCAGIQTEPDSSAFAVQQESLRYMLDFFLRYQRLIDLHETKGYSIERQNIASLSRPLSAFHVLCHPSNLDHRSDIIDSLPPLKQLQGMLNAVPETQATQETRLRLQEEIKNIRRNAERKSEYCIQQKIRRMRAYPDHSTEEQKAIWGEQIEAMIDTHLAYPAVRVVYLSPQTQVIQSTGFKLSPDRIALSQESDNRQELGIYVYTKGDVPGLIYGYQIMATEDRQTGRRQANFVHWDERSPIASHWILEENFQQYQ